MITEITRSSSSRGSSESEVELSRKTYIADADVSFNSEAYRFGNNTVGNIPMGERGDRLGVNLITVALESVPQSSLGSF